MHNPFQEICARLTNIEGLLLDIKHGELTPKPVLQPDGDELLTTAQAAEFLGLSVQTIYGKIHKKELPFHKPDGCKRVYFSKKALTEFVSAGRVKTNAEIEAEVSGKK